MFRPCESQARGHCDDHSKTCSRRDDFSEMEVTNKKRASFSCALCNFILNFNYRVLIILRLSD